MDIIIGLFLHSLCHPRQGNVLVTLTTIRRSLFSISDGHILALRIYVYPHGRGVEIQLIQRLNNSPRWRQWLVHLLTASWPRVEHGIPNMGVVSELYGNGACLKPVKTALSEGKNPRGKGKGKGKGEAAHWE